MASINRVDKKSKLAAAARIAAREKEAADMAEIEALLNAFEQFSKIADQALESAAKKFARIWYNECPDLPDQPVDEGMDMVWIEEGELYGKFMEDWAKQTGCYPWDGPTDMGYTVFRKALYAEGKRLLAAGRKTEAAQ